MKKIILFMMVLLMGGASDISAADNLIAEADVTEYSVRIKKVELCDSALASCFLLFDGDSGFIDIKAQGAGGVVKNLAAGKIPPNGTYTILRTTLTNSFKITAKFTSGGTTFFTNAATNFSGGTTHTVADTNTSAAKSVTTVTDFSGTGVGLPLTPYNNQTASGIYCEGPACTASSDLIHIASISITVTSETRPANVDITFDVHQKLVFNDDIVPNRYFRGGIPGVTVKLIP